MKSSPYRNIVEHTKKESKKDQVTKFIRYLERLSWRDWNICEPPYSITKYITHRLGDTEIVISNNGVVSFTYPSLCENFNNVILSLNNDKRQRTIALYNKVITRIDQSKKGKKRKKVKEDIINFFSYVKAHKGNSE